MRKELSSFASPRGKGFCKQFFKGILVVAAERGIFYPGVCVRRHLGPPAGGNVSCVMHSSELRGNSGRVFCCVVSKHRCCVSCIRVCCRCCGLCKAGVPPLVFSGKEVSFCENTLSCFYPPLTHIPSLFLHLHLLSLSLCRGVKPGAGPPSVGG